MKKVYLFVFFALLPTLMVNGQSRKYVSQFNQLQSYFNPSLTGYEGSIVRGFVRNQWAGLDGAPKTYFLSAEFDPAEIRDIDDAAVLGKTAFGFNMVHDNYGPFVDNEFLLSYASRIRLGRSTNLRLGAAINYNTIRLDGNNLTTEQANDPTVNQYINSFANMNILDFNLGMSITHQNFYFAYGAQNINQGGMSNGDVFMDKKPLVSIFQTGFKQFINQNLSVYSHVMYRIQSDLPSNIEFNAKAMLMEKFWLGLGHRVDYATNFQLGFLMSKVRFGYAYEIPAHRSYMISNPTHEFMASFFIFRKLENRGDMDNLIW
jgi:type IX secretion system PorP/SprF family membrane protein